MNYITELCIYRAVFDVRRRTVLIYCNRECSLRRFIFNKIDCRKKLDTCVSVSFRSPDSRNWRLSCKHYTSFLSHWPSSNKATGAILGLVQLRWGPALPLFGDMGRDPYFLTQPSQNFAFYGTTNCYCITVFTIVISIRKMSQRRHCRPIHQMQDDVQYSKASIEKTNRATLKIW